MGLTKAEELELIALLELEVAEMERNRPIWRPNRDKDNPERLTPQMMAITSEATIVVFGGGAGGGKSDFIIGNALLNHQYSLILRRTYSEFEQIQKRLIDLVGPENVTDKDTLVRFAGQKHPSIKAKRIKLGHMNTPLKDWKKYAGSEYDNISIDEFTDFPETIIRKITTWLRSIDPNQKCRLNLTCNPPTDSKGLWVIGFIAPWVDPTFVDHNKRPLSAKSGEVLHVARINDVDYFYREPQEITHHPVTGKQLTAPASTISRTFIQSLVKDNPFYAGKEYEKRLQALDERDYAAMYLGEWKSSLVDAIGQIFRGEAYKECLARWRSIEGTEHQPDGMPLCLGFDTAQGGEDDNTYIPIWECGYFGQKGSVSGKSANDAGKLCDWMENEIRTRWSCEPDEIPLSVDAIGGRDFIYEWVRRWPNALVYKFRGSEGAGVRGIFQTHKDQAATTDTATINAVSKLPFYSQGVTFLNKISAAYIRLGDATRHPDYRIAFPPDNELQRQLTARTAGTEKNRMAISPKEQFVKEFGKSPNEADAAVMAYWFIDVAIHLMLSAKELERFDEIQRIRASGL